MVKFTAVARSNHFVAKDPERFRKIMRNVEKSFRFSEKDGTVGFWVSGAILGVLVLDDDGRTPDTYDLSRDRMAAIQEGAAFDYDVDLFYQLLQSVVAEDDAIVIELAGNAGYSSVCGEVTVITSNEISFCDLHTMGENLVRKQLANSNWCLRDEY